jgi:hypothetical protein
MQYQNFMYKDFKQLLVFCPLGVKHVSELKECSVVFLCDFNQKWSMLTNFSKTPKYKMLMKICSAVPKLFHVYVQSGIFMSNLHQ